MHKVDRSRKERWFEMDRRPPLFLIEIAMHFLMPSFLLNREWLRNNYRVIQLRISKVGWILWVTVPRVTKKPGWPPPQGHKCLKHRWILSRIILLLVYLYPLFFLFNVGMTESTEWFRESFIAFRSKPELKPNHIWIHICRSDQFPYS